MKLYVKCDRCGEVRAAMHDYSASNVPLPPEGWTEVRLALVVRDQSTVRPRINKGLCGGCSDIIAAAIESALESAIKTEAVPA